jgi:hypothetical protein
MSAAVDSIRTNRLYVAFDTTKAHATCGRSGEDGAGLLYTGTTGISYNLRATPKATALLMMMHAFTIVLLCPAN